MSYYFLNYYLSIHLFIFPLLTMVQWQGGKKNTSLLAPNPVLTPIYKYILQYITDFRQGQRDRRYNSFHPSTKLSGPCQFSPVFYSAFQKGLKISTVGNRTGGCQTLRGLVKYFKGSSHMLYHLQGRMAHKTLIVQSPSHSVLSSLQEPQAQKATMLNQANNFKVKRLRAEGLGQIRERKPFGASQNKQSKYGCERHHQGSNISCFPVFAFLFLNHGPMLRTRALRP